MIRLLILEPKLHSTGMVLKNLFETLAKHRNILVEKMDTENFLKNYKVPIITDIIIPSRDIRSGDAIAVKIGNDVYLFWIGAYR